ncbi:MAG: FAD-binding protein [Chthoniobacterales bacterium]|nr:FAD-binding protein [Chthoniobacterales bacterium]
MKNSHRKALLNLLSDPSSVIEDLETRKELGKDHWFVAAVPEIAVAPTTSEEVAAVLGYANEHKIPVTTRGAGYGYVGGCVPVQGGILLSTNRLNRILEISKEDFVAVTQPGVITGHLQKAVQKKGLFYPPDPASLEHCSIGGNIATNAGGPRCLKYGVTRPYVLGLQIALADGSLVRLGGRTHKNKTGFDLIGMFVGSEGLLGIVTEATLRLLPQPPARAVLSAGFASMKTATAAVQKIFAAGYLPAAVEIADHFTLEAARSHVPARQRAMIPQGEAHLLLEIDGQAGAVKSDAKELQQFLQKIKALDVSCATSPQECNHLWALRRAFSASLRATGLIKLNEDIVVPRGRLLDLINFTEQLHRRTGFPIACFGHAGDGNIHVNIMVSEQEQQLESKKIESLLDELFTQVLAWGGAITGEHGIGIAKLAWWKMATTPELRELHQKIKGTLDPHGILNPGKFV